MSCARWLLPLVLLWAAAALETARAEDVNPFRQGDEERARTRSPAAAASPPLPLPPMAGVAEKPWFWGADRDPRARAAQPDARLSAPIFASPIEREALPPLDAERQSFAPSGHAPGLPAGGSGEPARHPLEHRLPRLWQGVDGASAARLVASLQPPLASPAMAALWRQMWAALATAATRAPGPLLAVRAEALHRSGHILDLVSGGLGSGEASEPAVAALVARARIGLGDQERGCAGARSLARGGSDVPRPMRAEMLLLTAYCAAATGDLAAASLAADLARGEEADAPLALAILEALTTDQPVTAAVPQRVRLMDYKFLELAGSPRLREALERGEPALLAAVAQNEAGEITTRIIAGELAARANAIDPARLVYLYRLAPAETTGSQEPALQRATLFKTIETERTPQRKTRLIRQLLDNARRAGLLSAVAASLAPPAETLAPVAEIGWFAETAVQIGLAAGRADLAAKWIEAAQNFDRGNGLQHWLVLLDIAAPMGPARRVEALSSTERLAVGGRFDSDLLHRLATVLDALDYQIPIPLWEAASRTPQPSSGHLPETGVLAQLQEAVRRREPARTVMLVLQTLGPAAPGDAHIIALGDSVRALAQVGFGAEARRLAIEAVLPAWPQQAGGG